MSILKRFKATDFKQCSYTKMKANKTGQICEVEHVTSDAVSELTQVSDYNIELIKTLMSQKTKSDKVRNIFTSFVSENNNVTKAINDKFQLSLSFAEQIATAFKNTFKVDVNANMFSRDYNTLSTTYARLTHTETATADTTSFQDKAILKLAKSDYNKLIKKNQTEEQIIDYLFNQNVDKAIIAQVCKSYKVDEQTQ